MDKLFPVHPTPHPVLWRWTVEIPIQLQWLPLLASATASLTTAFILTRVIKNTNPLHYSYGNWFLSKCQISKQVFSSMSLCVTAQCLPSNVVAQLDCNNTLAVHWDRSASNPDSYTALAIGTDGTRVSCNTSSTSCTIKNLRCGRTYSIAVTTSKTTCVVDGSDYHIQTGNLTSLIPTAVNNPKTVLQ